MASTKGKGTFYDRERKDFRDINQTGDIFGAQVSTLKKAPTTERQTNPLSPDYKIPGAVEYAGTTRHALDWIGSSCPPKKDRNPPKPAGKETKPHVDFHKPLDKDQLAKDRNTFYAEEGRGPEIDVNKLYQAAKNPKQGEAPGVSDKLREKPDF